MGPRPHWASLDERKTRFRFCSRPDHRRRRTAAHAARPGRLQAGYAFSAPPSIPLFPCGGGSIPLPQGKVWVGDPRSGRLRASRPRSRDRGRGAGLCHSPAPWGGTEGGAGGRGGGGAPIPLPLTFPVPVSSAAVSPSRPPSLVWRRRMRASPCPHAAAILGVRKPRWRPWCAHAWPPSWFSDTQDLSLIHI